MKKHILLSLLFILSLWGYSQQPTSPIVWSKVYGGTLSEKTYSIYKTNDNGYIVVGSAESADGNLTQNFGIQDYWVVKTDMLGNIQWQNVYGGLGIDVATSVIQTSDGGYIVAGYSNSTDISQYHGGFDYWVLKLNLAGTMEWQKSYGGTGDDKAFDVIQCYDNGYMIVGSSTSSDGNITTHMGMNDAWIVKTDVSGTIMWQQSFGGTLNDEARSALQASDNTFTIACNTESNDINVSLNKGLQDVWVIQLSASGNLLTQQTYGGSQSDKVAKIITTKDGGFFAVGSSNSIDGQVTGNHGALDFWALKLTPTLNLLWQKSFGGTGIDEATSVVEAVDSSLVITGYSQSVDGEVFFNHGMSDYWSVMLNKSGGVKWQRALGGSAYDYGQGIVQATDHNFVVAGSTQSADGNVLFNHGANDYWLVKLKCLTADFIASNDSICPNQTVTFTNYSQNANQFIWKINNVEFDNQFNSQFTFATPGNYKITLLATNSTCSDSIIKIIHVFAPPLVNLGNDTAICSGTSLTLHSGFDNSFDIFWSTGETTPSIVVNASGLYWVNIIDPLTGCMKADSIVVTMHPPFGVSLGPDQSVCAGNTVTLDAGFYTGANFLWSTNATTQSISVNSPGIYSVTVTNSTGCKAMDTASVNINPNPMVNLGPDRTPCMGNTAVLDAGAFATYLWSGGQNTQTITVSTPGNYSVTVTNTFGCTDRDTVNVTFKPNPNPNLGSDMAFCYGTTATLDAGMFAGATYSWSSGQNTQAINPTTTNYYSVTITSPFGCKGIDTVFVTVNPTPSINLGPNLTPCAGTTTVLDAGSASGVNYLWSTSQTSQTINATSSGNYSITVTNTFGCSDRDTVNLTFKPNPTVNLGSDISICNGNSAILDAGMFTGAAYSWSSGQNTQIINATASGNYSVTVTSPFGCKGIDTVFVTVNPSPLVNLGPDINSCAGSNVTLNAGTGGTGISWSTGQTTQTIQVNSTGNYFVTVINSYSCAGKDTVFVTFNPKPSILSDSLKNISCFGLADGAIYSSVVNGTGSYSYQWTGTASTTEDITDLGPGNYSMIVTDAVGCKDTSSYTIIEPAALNVDSVKVMNATCSYSTDGSIQMYISGGTQPYWYSIDNGISFISVPEFTSLSAGNYDIVIKDANNCSVNYSGIPVTVLNNLSVNLGNDTIICSGSSVTIDAGSPGSTYLWNTSESTQTITVTTGGTYSVTVTSDGCSATDYIIVTQNTPIVANIDSIWDVTCYGLGNGAIFTSFAGGTAPYIFAWSNTAQNNEDISNLAAGFYELTITDSLGCTGLISATINESDEQLLTHSTINTTCYGASDGAITINVNGGTSPYTFQWSSGITNPVNLSPGIYSVTVTDSNACTAFLTDTIYSPDELKITIDSITDALICGTATGNIYTSATGGTEPYTYVWDGTSVTTEDISNILPGTYTVSVTDNNGCSAFATATVYDVYCQTYVVPGFNTLSVCDASTFYDLSPIIIIENVDTSSGFIAGQNDATLILNAPTGFEFNPDSGNVYFGNGLNDITAASISVVPTKITVTMSTGPNHLKADTLKIAGIEVKTLNPPTVLTENIFTEETSTLLINGTTLNTVYGKIHQSAEMIVSQIESFQADSNLVVRGSMANEILGVRISTTGNCGIPMKINGFEFNTNGSDNAPYNIPEAKVFYTGHSPYFAAINTQGTSLNPDGQFMVTDATPQELLEGDNYFWLAYNIQDSAYIMDYVDGQCIKVIIDSTYYYPVFSGPEYKRQISTLSDFVSHGSGGWNSGPTWGGGKATWAPDGDNNVTIINGDTITLTTNSSCANLTITDGLLILGSYQLTISGNLDGNEKDSIRSTSSSSLVINDLGNATQFTIPKAMKKLKKLTINRANGASCDHDLDMDDAVPSDSVVVVLSNGAMVMSSGKKFLMNSHAIKKEISSSNNTYIDGVVSRYVKRNTGFSIFPLGNKGESRSFGVSVQSGNMNNDNANEVQFFWEKPVNYDYVNENFLPGGITDKMYWRHVNVSGADTKRRIYYHDSDFPGLNDTERDSALCLANTSAATPTTEWTKETTPYAVYDETGKKYVEFSNGNASNDEYWTFGSVYGSMPLVESSLPIELYSFDAVLEESVVNLDWVTISETNNDYFIIERAGTDLVFSPLFTVDGAGNSYSTLLYHIEDDAPLDGTSYYRLKQTDFNGDYTYSELRMVVNNQDIPVMIYPNPVTKDMFVQIYASEDETIYLSLIDEKGSLIYDKEFQLQKGNNQIHLNVENLRKCPYILRMDTENNSLVPVRKIILKM